MRDTTVYSVRVIERAMHILACFDDDHPERGISEIAQIVSLPAPTVLRILATLQGGGYVERAPGGDKFRLGPRLMDIALGIVRRHEVCRVAKPFMRALEGRFEETCDLSVFIRGEMVCIEVVQSRHPFRIAATPGYHSPLHCTATGKVFLAHLSAQDAAAALSTPLRRYTDKTITSPERLMEQMGDVRARGYGLDDEEFREGIRAVAAPILDSAGRLRAVMGIPGPRERMGDRRRAEIAAALVEATRDISLGLSSSPESAGGAT